MRNIVYILNRKDRKWGFVEMMDRLVFLGNGFWDGDLFEGNLSGGFFRIL